MSWDVLVLNYNGHPPAEISEMTENNQPEPLGTSADVREIITQTFAGVEWSEPVWGTWSGEEFSLEFSIGKGELAGELIVSVRGGGDAVAALLQLAVPRKWSLLDCSTGEFLNPEDPAREGWEGFQNFRDSISGLEEE